MLYCRRCLSVCLSVGNFVQKRPNGLHEIFRNVWQWVNKQTLKFWWRSGSQIWIRIHIATLVMRALAEVCTVPVFLV